MTVHVSMYLHKWRQTVGETVTAHGCNCTSMLLFLKAPRSPNHEAQESWKTYGKVQRKECERSHIMKCSTRCLPTFIIMIPVANSNLGTCACVPIPFMDGHLPSLLLRLCNNFSTDGSRKKSFLDADQLGHSLHWWRQLFPKTEELIPVYASPFCIQRGDLRWDRQRHKYQPVAVRRCNKRSWRRLYGFLVYQIQNVQIIF